MKLTAGRIVQYIISLADIEAIEAQRARMAELLLISPGQIGNTYVPGEIVPMVIARTWSDTCVNGQLILDGQDTLWVTSRNRDDSKPHQSWHWPEIEGVCELRVSEQPLKNGSGIAPDIAFPDVSDAHQAVSTMAAKVARLEDELDRKRQAENDLIQDRDRLIHGDIADLHKQLGAAHDKIKTRTDQFNNVSEHANALTHRLNDSAERERRLSERLANIASLVSDM